MVGPSALHVSSADTSTMLLESDDDSGSTNFSESSDSDVDYAQEKNWNETDYIVLEDMYEAVIAHDSGAVNMACHTNFAQGDKKFHLLDNVGLRKMFSVCWRHCYCLLTSNTVAETDRYTHYCIHSSMLKPKSRMSSW
jgi:hypothetical protein